MDFSNLKSVDKVNPRGQSFDFKWNQAKGEFTFSDAKFEEMDLENNSLREFCGTSEKDAEGKEKVEQVFLGVCAGNSGTFYKKTKGVNKGRKFKNTELSDHMKEAGLDPNSLSLIYKGDNNGVQMFQIVDDSIQNTEEDAPLEQGEEDYDVVQDDTPKESSSEMTEDMPDEESKF